MIDDGFNNMSTFTFKAPETVAERARHAFDIVYEAVGVENDSDEDQLDKHEERRLLALIASPLLAEVFKALAPTLPTYQPYTYLNNVPIGAPTTTTGPRYPAPGYYGTDGYITAHFGSVN